MVISSYPHDANGRACLVKDNARGFGSFAHRDAGYLELEQGNGAGVFTPMPGSPVQRSNAADCPSVAIGDVNGDGHTDRVTGTWLGYKPGGDAPLRSGVLFVRLSQGTKVATTRVTVLR